MSERAVARPGRGLSDGPEDKGTPFGIMFTLEEYGSLEGTRDAAGAIADFEARHDALVYAATAEFAEGRTQLDLLFVSRYVDEWEQDRVDLALGTPLCYVDAGGGCGEFGRIGVKASLGGLVRTA